MIDLIITVNSYMIKTMNCYTRIINKKVISKRLI